MQTCYYRLCITALLVVCLVWSFAQPTQVYKPSINRVLFVLDVSGSMKEKWGAKTKYETACELLYKLIDSVEQKNPNVEFAVRVLGFQYSRTEKNCKDSKLLVPFSKNNAANIRLALNKISPQGMTPIAYSLQQAIGDFPADGKALNSIIIITDGNENCEDNPCAVAQQLIDKRISVRPFVVGLDVGEKYTDKLKCIGTVLDTKTDSSFYNTVGVIIRQTLNTTTTQINLLDAAGQPTVTNLPFTLYDHYSKKILYNFVHSLNEKGNPDTLFLDPVGVYDLELHTIPPLRKNEIELVAGKHNVIAIDVPLAPFTAESPLSNFGNNDAQAVVRNAAGSILQVQNLNVTENFLKQTYRVQVTTTPDCFVDTLFLAFTDNRWAVAHYGILSFNADRSYLTSIYQNEQLVLRLDVKPKVYNQKLQPGKYRLVYKPTDSRESSSTRIVRFEIKEAQTTSIELKP